MRVRDIATLPVEAHMSPEVKQLRKQAPDFIKKVIERTYAVKEIGSLRDLSKDSVSPVAGGNLSAVYFLKAHDYRVMKFRYAGIMAEAKSLREWRKHGARVVAVKHTGFVPGTRHTSHPVKYVIEESIMNKQGEPAQTAYAYAQQHPERAKTIGRALGTQLALMHRAKSDRTFGEFADMWGKKAPFKTWNAYLLNYVKNFWDDLLEAGLSETQLRTLQELIHTMRFSRKGVYCHGDFSMRNALVESERPLQLCIFDPNPLIGHPSWDIAILFNNEEYARRRYEKEPSNMEFQNGFYLDYDCLRGFVEAYELASGKKIIHRQVLMSQFTQMTFLYDIEKKKCLRRKINPSTALEAIVRKEAMLGAALQLLEGS